VLVRPESIREAAAVFGLGPVLAEPVPVPGGLSNELWRMRTGSGTYAVKRMVLAADRPDFVANVEASFRVERHARSAGVPMPAPVPDPRTGRALARVHGALARVHVWEDGTPAAGAPGEAAALLARIHTVGAPRWADAEPPDPRAAAWAPPGLVERIPPPPARAVRVDGHRDLDRKNTLRRPDGTLLALDWDAAGPTTAVWEAVGVALDWAELDPAGVRSVLAVYREAAGIAVPAEPWVFGGWVSAACWWIRYNATGRAGTPPGADEAAGTRAELSRFAAAFDELVDALR
jgi:hypothetical protein